MKQTKKTISLVVLLLLVIALFMSACSKNQPSASGGNEASASNAGASAAANDGADAPADLKPYKLKLVYEGPPQADEAMVEDALNKILTEKINATIDIAPIDWGAWDDKVNLMIASREPVDILFTAQWNGYSKNVAKGAYKELGDLLSKYGQGIVSSLDPSFLEGSKINGKNYGIPTNKELAFAGGVVYRKDIADELGLDMSTVKTAEDLDAIYKVVKEKKPDMTPLYMQGGSFGQLTEFDSLGDGTIPGVISKEDSDTTVKMMEDFDIYKRYLKLARDFFQKGYINKDAATTQLSSGDAYKGGNVFSTIEPLKPGKAAEIANAAGIGGKLDQIYLTGKTVSTSETAGAMLAISTTSKNPERAMMFINLLHTDKDIVNLLNFGIEGVHYTLSGDVMTPTDKSGQYAPGVAWELGNQFLNHVWNTEAPDKWEQFKAFNEGAKPSPGLGFVFNSDSVKAEVGALANVIKQYQKALETGSVDTDKVLPEYIAALKSAGVEKVIAEKQKQFDAFLAAKGE
ncbi:carbohydrate ABC transporter substrate-binding protein (CUT1 family) [Paenibacillus sp. BK033]|uniref:ABC transporter substrate-binding protein n=1 Tax=Paenibacillus sp. BK033 TaxID=2512133 RepID=UPI0010486854|nr:ABC transporter substrate-binding protein [Paenibacillus sp. BK033]TCM97847.1 carbohydrate ABC transporter substrate-binding protein (CUT1 family) [Paenibacillus sp. BK033]